MNHATRNALQSIPVCRGFLTKAVNLYFSVICNNNDYRLVPLKPKEDVKCEDCKCDYCECDL